MEDCVPLLEPLFEVTEEISGDKFCTSSIVVPLLRGCQKSVQGVNHVSEIGKSLKTCLLKAMSRRMTPYESYSSGICAKAAILDPRLKTCGFGLPANATNTVTELITEINREVELGAVSEKAVMVSEEVMNPGDVTLPSKKKKMCSFLCVLRVK